MTKKILTIFSIVLIATFCVIMVFLLMFWPKPLLNHMQNINYAVSDQYVKNPDQGFYRTLFIKLTQDGGTFTPVLYDDFQMYHLRIDISEFENEFSNQALRTLDSALNYYFEKEKNVIIRFSYDANFEGNVNDEPPIDVILSHIGELSEVLNNYVPTITAVEAGMIGPWGEMHSSDISTPENINKVIDAWLDNCPDLCVLVRTPKMIYDYLGVDFNNISNYNFIPNNKTKRLGLFNDAFLSTENDLGTYHYGRENEIEWISENIINTPYGGEVLESDLQSNIFPNCIDEMFSLNLSYLNYEYQKSVIDSWKTLSYENTTAYNYVQTHLGCRLELTNSVFWYNDEFKQLKISLTIDNSGFSNYVREKDVTIIFVSDDNKLFEYNAGKYNGERNFEIILKSLPQKQNYDVYIALSNNIDNVRTYPIQFANTTLYNSTLGANLIGNIEF